MPSSKSDRSAALSAEDERLIKRRITGAPHEAVLRVTKGFSEVALAEVEALLAAPRLQPKLTPTVELATDGIHVSNIGWRDLLSLAAHLTTVREVLWVIGGGRAGSVGELKERLAAIKWSLYLPPNAPIALRVTSTASHVFHEGKIADLATRELKRSGFSVGEREHSPHLLDLRLLKDRLAVSLSLAGRPLYQRKYKTEFTGTATVKEDIAAAAIRACLAFAQEHGLSEASEVFLPFAGSGTFGFEATIALAKIPPWIFFGPLSAEAFPCCATASLAFARKTSLAGVRPPESLHIYFNDVSDAACASLKANIASFDDRLRAVGLPTPRWDVEPGDAFSGGFRARLKPGKPVLIFLNPPFGARLSSPAETNRLYIKLGRELAKVKSQLAGFAFAPTLATAESCCQGLARFSLSTRPFNHGGKTVYLILFCRLSAPENQP